MSEVTPCRNTRPAAFLRDMQGTLCRFGPGCHRVTFDVVRAHHGHHDLSSWQLHGAMRPTLSVAAQEARTKVATQQFISIRKASPTSLILSLLDWR